MDLSSIYLDILKDRLYTEKDDSLLRRSAQTAMYEILTSLVRLVAPVICFTAEEVWQALPNREEREWSVHMADMPAENDRYLDKALEEKWKKRLALRSVVTKALEEARQAKVIGHPLDAEITIYADGEHLETLKAFASEDGTVKVSIAVCTLEKCERCWKRTPDVNSDPKHEHVCARCAKVLTEMGE